MDKTPNFAFRACGGMWLLILWFHSHVTTGIWCRQLEYDRMVAKSIPKNLYFSFEKQASES